MNCMMSMSMTMVRYSSELVDAENEMRNIGDVENDEDRSCPGRDRN
jgi:hypothetical protein